MKFGKIEWLVSGLTAGYALNTIYQKARLVTVNVPYLEEIASSQDADIKTWLITSSAELVVFGLASFILVLFLLRSFNEVWLTKKEKVLKEEKVKVKGKKEEVKPEPRMIKFE